MIFAFPKKSPFMYACLISAPPNKHVTAVYEKTENKIGENSESTYLHGKVERKSFPTKIANESFNMLLFVLI